ncbi:MAG: reverse transcriptase [Desulfobacterales bacterium]|nr:reverse transcriptase [Desulfobacterales bacterium]
MTLNDALESRQWQPSPPVSFTVSQPKAREIHAAAFRDRVVHHYLVPRLEKVYEPVFIHDAYSNRKGKGTHAAVRRLQYFMRQVRANCPGYYLQLDIKNFFISIDREILFELVQRRLRKAHRNGKQDSTAANHLRSLTHQVLRQDAGAEVINIATPQEMACVPEHKRMVNAGRHKGLPIGNLTSQFFANVYLKLDQFVKHRLKCRDYLRYVDDFVLLHRSPEQLQVWREAIEDFLRDKLSLALRDEGRLRPINNGVDFLGYIARPGYLLVRRRVVGNLSGKLLGWQRKHIRGSVEQGWRCTTPSRSLEAIRAVLASYVGHFGHARHYRLIELITCHHFPWLLVLFGFIPMPRENSVRIVPLTASIQVSSYQSQIRWLSQQFFNARVIVQRGRENDYLSGVGQDKARVIKHSIGCHPAVRLRGAVHSAHVVENGYLCGGLKRRTIRLLQFSPGVALCTMA